MSSGSARDLRLSDAERELAVSDLKEHCAAGRLTLEELPDRVASVYRATTYGELAEAMAGLPDLPSVPSSPPARRKSRRPWFPGRAPFLQTLEVVQPPEDVLAKALKNVAPSLTRFGFEIAVIERDRIIFERSFARPGRSSRSSRFPSGCSPCSSRIASNSPSPSRVWGMAGRG